jgi:hypothetical protein
VLLAAERERRPADPGKLCGFCEPDEVDCDWLKAVRLFWELSAVRPLTATSVARTCSSRCQGRPIAASFARKPAPERCSGGLGDWLSGAI